MSEISRTSRRDRCLTLTAALLGWAFDGFEMGVFPIIARPALSELLGNSATEELIRQWNGTLAIAFLLGAALGGAIFGRLGDRIGRVRALALSVLVYAGLTGLSGLARTPWELAGLRFLAATGMGGEWALGVALVVETWPASARPWLAGLIGTAVNLGYVAVAELARVIDPATSWRQLLGICAVPALFTFFVRLYVPESARWQQSVSSEARPGFREIFSPLLRRNTLFGGAAAALVMFAIWGGVQFTQLWAAQLAGSLAAAQVQRASAGAAAVGALAAPILLFHIRRRGGYFLLSAAAFVSGEYLFLGHAQFDNSFLVAVAVAGLCTGAFNGWLPLYLPELFPTRLRATGQGTCYNAGRILAAGGVWATTAFDVSGSYPQICAIVIGAYAVGMVLAWRLPETAGTELG